MAKATVGTKRIDIPKIFLTLSFLVIVSFSSFSVCVSVREGNIVEDFFLLLSFSRE